MLLLTDQVDAFWPERLPEFDNKPLRSVTQGAADLSKFAPTDAPEGEPADVTALLAALKTALGDRVMEVRATDRLVESAVVLSAASFGPDLQMQRLMRRHQKEGMGLPPTLEINPRHALIRDLAGRVAENASIEDAALTLLDLARVQDGDLPTDPAGFARRVTAALSSK